MRTPFIRQRSRGNGNTPRESDGWLWYVVGLLTFFWLLYTWFFE
ncbi:hypothetical protein HNQ93_002380 [Hymenobacter luteus]|uniref:Uncharacterized protein n=2 Tax=Hymenobacter TaxID=89966 RepID=A0A7W9T215_9BACT|nr:MULTISPECIES: hypothetical protein [Hymenobacter]MBB4602051.1 hypothetical protein [Hymenobacter latericoloratus]MBB6059520.1 hypothetical protein [Hymenobacter luteus]